ncbi:siderophore-interacting protein [Ralstonia solanacearum]|uniref:siderophore-interacting protein n=1 Tax=Ralstonia solanacearum TaxID=305 RepID=UPI00030A10C8|nr:siderophore-interacting protein [Ralstonia solanacearum]MDC6178604.1 siderophore-interacting protein [Ralstonia solanacearum]MDC6212195.1 siderophore-interacting protein [Ralstonia solanacearum]MDC6239817.1 siderophore-interacting protein [Ralstonia solanacearum]MDD7801548.1 siderophore-interacting protein [Ralstonia solanacearum]TYZ55156.1 siderophore-interacting protein [Ralstonia solanacearum]
MFTFNRTQGLMSQLLAPLKPATRHVRVRTIHTLSPRMRRVVFASDTPADLADLADAPPGAAIKLMFPLDATAGTQRTVGRAYTIRRYHAGRAELEVDFVVHDETPADRHGPAARWLERAAPGDTIEFTGPKRGFHLDPEAPWALLIGDETALPAISAILETLPAHVPARAFVAISDARARLPLEGVASAAGTHAHDRDIHWVESDTAHAGAMMVSALSTQTLPAGTPQVLLAGESSLLKQVRALLEGAWNIPRDAILAKGYWTLGLSREARRALEDR